MARATTKKAAATPRKAPAEKAATRRTPAEVPAEVATAQQSQFDAAMLIDLIDPHPHNVRHDDTADVELIDSVREQGLLEPLLVAPHLQEEGRWRLIAGHRRRDALVKAGFTHAPVFIRHDLTSEADQIAAMLVENGRRKDITPIEEAEGVERVGLPLQGTSLIVDEEGLLRERPLNPVASLIFGHALVGDALLAAEGYVDDELDWIDCDPEDLLTRFGALVCAAAATEVAR